MKNKLIQLTWFKFLSFVLMMFGSLIFLGSVIIISILADNGIYYQNENEYISQIRDSYTELTDEELMISNIESGYIEGSTANQRIYFDDVRMEKDIELISFGYGIRFWIIAVAVIGLVVFAAFFVCLMCGAGRHRDVASVEPGWDYKLWFDIELIFSAIAVLFSAELLSSTFLDIYDPISLVILTCCFIMDEAIVVGLCMSFAVRIKLGKWWDGTFLYRCIIKPLTWLFKYMFSAFGKIPIVWKTTIIVVTYIILNCLITSHLNIYFDTEAVVAWYVIQLLVIAPIVISFSYQLKKLEIAGEELSKGDLDYKIDTKGLRWEIKKHAENLNSIGDGMGQAVMERTKSDRMKTELISNVSHDIKTPLTSIINYTNLISREECDNPKIMEYTEVLHRNSERLKRLMEDIIEASKASTGNLDVNLEPCDASIIINQIVGEFEEKFETKGLTVIVKEPEESISIMADARRLWRVFDNLFNNIFKYAMPGTRVYVTLERISDRVVFILKNTSAVELDIDPDELMERFVRADASRNTEGNGLGLSIAKSLTELQKGTFRLSIDGDLFKAIISFPYIENP
ncbi:MAG: HAMP domain-containing histidine kinase [Lachnospiraceae bacterium]|nr:HAMP domain-containing histidine kinase [Lachnospiraceae bacterium]